MCTTLALCLCGCLSASEAVAGFSNSNVILIGAFLVIGQAIFATGLAHDIATFAMRFAKSERKQVFAVSLVTALLSGFLSNTGVAAMMIPIVMGICHESGTHRSKLMMPISIGQEQVDYVVPVETIGDPAGIATGAMRPDRSPLNRRIAELTAKAIICSGHLREGAAMQTGSGKISLSVAGQIERYMMDRQISGDFAMGGITAILVRMRKEGLLRTLYDTQSFDQTAIRSLAEDPAHCEVSAEAYASPLAKGGPIVDGLDFVILGATEIDVDFNVNVITNSNNQVISGAGGHGDTAEGAKMTVITAPLFRGKYPVIVDRVTTLTTPGRFVDVFVCQEGIAVNTAVQKNRELADRLRDAGLPVLDIHDLQRRAERYTGKLPPLKPGGRTVGLVYWRDGTVLDEIKRNDEL